MTAARGMTDELRQRFDELFEEALETLPPRLHDLLEEIPVILDDRPDAALMRLCQEEWGEADPIDPLDMAGLHTGVALTERSVEAPASLPDEIRLFREGIVRIAGGWSHPEADEAIYEQIVITLLHEIGHHFGLDEDDLASLGYD